MVYLSNCKSQKKLYQEQLFYWNSIETEAALFMCLFIRFLYLGYNYLLLKKKKKDHFSTHNWKRCKVSIVPNWHPVEKITTLYCGKTAHGAVSIITHVSKGLFEILHIESVCLHVMQMHLSLFV